MKSNITKLVATFAVAFAFTIQLSAQGEQAGTGGLVTVLDVAKVFEQNPAFNSQMEAIKSEAESLKMKIEAKQEAIRKEVMALQEFEIGSPERNQKEAELEQRQASLRTEARQAEQELLNREAIIYYETYRILQDVVTKVAQKNQISLVLRYDSAEIEKTNRAEVIKGVNRTVVYHRQLDLTKMVSEQMNTATASTGAGNLK